MLYTYNLGSGAAYLSVPPDMTEAEFGEVQELLHMAMNTVHRRIKAKAQPEATTGLNPRLTQDANDQVEETT